MVFWIGVFVCLLVIVFVIVFGRGVREIFLDIVFFGVRVNVCVFVVKFGVDIIIVIFFVGRLVSWKFLLRFVIVFVEICLFIIVVIEIFWRDVFVCWFDICFVIVVGFGVNGMVILVVWLVIIMVEIVFILKLGVFVLMK